MGNFRKNVKKASMARGSVDKAQNQLMKRMNKKLDELETGVETKYNIQKNSDVVSAYSGATLVERSDQIIKILIGADLGVSDQERVGDQVTFKHIDFNYKVRLPFLRATEFSTAANTVRIMLFWDNQPSAISSAGSLITNPVYWPELLQGLTPAATVDDQREQAMLANKDWDQRKRFNIIYDKCHTFSSSSGNGGPRCCSNCIKFSKSYVGQKIRYVGGGTIVQNRQLYLAYTSNAGINQGTTPAQRCIIDYNIRTLYDDM